MSYSIIIHLSQKILTYQEALQDKTIQGKPVCLFENHAHALLPWARWRSRSEQPLSLLSIDHHSDTNSCYLRHLFQQVGRNLELMEELRTDQLNQIHIDDQNSITKGLEGLYHDEHIHAALRLKILDQAFIIQHSFDKIDSALAERGMQVIPTEIDLTKSTIREKETYFDLILESDFLTRQLDHWREQTPSFNYKKSSYILDIDLDVFKSFKSAQPNNHNIFYNLIRYAKGITIARESQWVERLRNDSQLDSKKLESDILKHIHNALA